jgi:hypothetical protein
MINEQDILVRLAKLEARVEKLDGQSAAPKVVTPRPYVEEGTRVTTYLPAAPTSFEMPSGDEMGRLYQVVQEKFGQLRIKPILNPNWRQEEDLKFDRQGFDVAFKWIATLGRVDELSVKFAPSYWVSVCESFQRSRGLGGSVGGRTILCAAIAAGDVRFAVNGFPHCLELGLSFHTGRPAAPGAWRGVLNGEFLQPVEVERIVDHSIGLQRRHVLTG